MGYNLDGTADYINCGDINQDDKTAFNMFGWCNPVPPGDTEFLMGVQNSGETRRYTFAAAWYDIQSNIAIRFFCLGSWNRRNRKPIYLVRFWYYRGCYTFV